MDMNERNRPLTDMELDQMLPSQGYEVSTQCLLNNRYRCVLAGVSRLNLQTFLSFFLNFYLLTVARAPML